MDHNGIHMNFKQKYSIKESKNKCKNSLSEIDGDKIDITPCHCFLFRGDIHNIAGFHLGIYNDMGYINKPRKMETP